MSATREDVLEELENMARLHHLDLDGTIDWWDAGASLIYDLIGSGLDDEETVMAFDILSERTTFEDNLYLEMEGDGYEDESWEIAALAVYRNKPEVCRWIVERTGETESVNPWDESLLSLAKDHPSLITWLLECGADRNKTNKYGETPFMTLCESPSWSAPLKEAARALLDEDYLEQRNEAGRNALSISIASGNMEAMRMTVDAMPPEAIRQKMKFLQKLADESQNPEMGEWLKGLCLAQKDKDALVSDMSEEDKRMERFGRLMQKLIEEGRISMDGVALKSMDEVKEPEPGKGRKKKI